MEQSKGLEDQHTYMGMSLLDPFGDVPSGVSSRGFEAAPFKDAQGVYKLPLIKSFDPFVGFPRDDRHTKPRMAGKRQICWRVFRLPYSKVLTVF